jgi:rod shape-determining protein MreC
MQHTTPPFFKRGPAPLVRLAFFVSLSVAILVLDVRFRYAEGLRQVFALAAYPFQQLATLPVTLAERVTGFFASQATLREENGQLRARLLDASRDAQRYQAAEAEAEQLRRLIGAAQRSDPPPTTAEILYGARDLYSQKVIIGRGATHGIVPGSPVVDEVGAIGQVTRVHPLVSEVTLIVDKDQVIPVQVVRNGLRAIAFGGGSSGQLELRYMAADVDVQEGDQLVTSGIDSTYPPDLPVATVVHIERDSANAFARILCQPAAGVARGRYVLVLKPPAKVVPRPGVEPAERRPGVIERPRAPRRKPADAAK